MEYDRQTLVMETWATAVREWIFLDQNVRQDLLEKYPELLTPVDNAWSSSVTYYNDITLVVSLWENTETHTVRLWLQDNAPVFYSKMESLATVISPSGKALLAG